jgi:hypothetical protein
MSTAVWTNQVEPNSVADEALKAAAGLSFLVAVIGQWAFLYYIVAFYGFSTFTGNFQVWNRNTFLNMAYVPGVTAGSLTFAAHTLLAAVIAFGGAMQLIPQIRARAISVHRWIGRVFFVTGLELSGSGLYMEWVRGDRFNMVGAVAISLNAVLIILRRPVHLLLGLRLLPCASCRFLELYLRTKESAGPRWRFAVAGGLFVLTVLMSVGIFGFTMLTWQFLAKL